MNVNVCLGISNRNTKSPIQPRSDDPAFLPACLAPLAACLCLKLAAWGETARTETEDAQDGNEFG